MTSHSPPIPRTLPFSIHRLPYLPYSSHLTYRSYKVLYGVLTLPTHRPLHRLTNFFSPFFLRQRSHTPPYFLLHTSSYLQFIVSEILYLLAWYDLLGLRTRLHSSTQPCLTQPLSGYLTTILHRRRLGFGWATRLGTMTQPLEKVAHDTSSGEDEAKSEVDRDGRNNSNSPFSRKTSVTAGDKARRNVNAKLANPLAGYSHAELEEMGAEYARKYQLGDESDIRAFRMGAVLAQDPVKYEECRGLTEEEVQVLRREFERRWSQPRLMYVVIVLCSTCAAVQGMGEFSMCTRDGAAMLTGPQTSRSSMVDSSSTANNSASEAKIRDRPGCWDS